MSCMKKHLVLEAQTQPWRRLTDPQMCHLHLGIHRQHLGSVLSRRDTALQHWGIDQLHWGTGQGCWANGRLHPDSSHSRWGRYHWRQGSGHLHLGNSPACLRRTHFCQPIAHWHPCGSLLHCKRFCLLLQIAHCSV